MRRRALCGVVLGLLLLPALVAGVHALADEAALCACTPRVCRCTHQHEGATRPHCHFPGGSPNAGKSTPRGPAIQRCDTDQQQALASQFFVLPPQVSLIQSVASEAVISPLALQLPAPFDDISPPPPRAPLA